MKLSLKFTVKGCIKYDLFLYNLVSGETGHCQLGIAKSVSPPPVLRVASEAHSDKGPYFMTADDGIFLEKCILPDISFLFLLYLPPSSRFDVLFRLPSRLPSCFLAKPAPNSISRREGK